MRASEGKVLLHGEDLSGLAAAPRTRRGLGRAFQLTNLFPELSVEENVRLAVQAHSGMGLNLWSVWSSHTALLRRALEILEAVALAGKRRLLARELAHGDQRKLEVALLMALEPDVFMFDEPTAGMSADEVPVILDLIRRLKARADKTILLVEHKMDVVRELSDRVVVLHNGRLVAAAHAVRLAGSPAQPRRSPDPCGENPARQQRRRRNDHCSRWSFPPARLARGPIPPHRRSKWPQD